MSVDIKVNIKKNRIGLTLLEIIVAMLILSLVMYELLSVLVVSKRFVYHSGSLVTGAELGKFFFEDANLSVSSDYFPCGNCLYNNTSCVSVNRTLNNIQYNITYRTNNVTNLTDVIVPLRKVVIDVNWVEPK